MEVWTVLYLICNMYEANCKGMQCVLSVQRCSLTKEVWNGQGNEGPQWIKVHTSIGKWSCNQLKAVRPLGDLKFSPWWLLIWCCSRMWYSIIWYTGTNFLEETAAPINRFLCNTSTYVQSTWHWTPQIHNLDTLVQLSTVIIGHEVANRIGGAKYSDEIHPKDLLLWINMTVFICTWCTYAHIFFQYCGAKHTGLD